LFASPLGPSKDDETTRVEKELAHIREAFINPKKLDVYNRKKYVLKLMYISILGYSIEFGHMEAMELPHTAKYQDKVIVCYIFPFFVILTFCNF
jgi:AP-2 complex subunit alpha